MGENIVKNVRNVYSVSCTHSWSISELESHIARFICYVHCLVLCEQFLYLKSFVLLQGGRCNFSITWPLKLSF